MKHSTVSLLTAAAFAALLLAAGCSDGNDGPAENAGEAVDEAVDDAGDAVEEAGDKVEDATN